MSGNIIIELWKIEWVGNIDQTGHQVKIVFKSGNTERSLAAEFTKRELIIKQSVIVPLANDKANLKVSVTVGEVSC